MKNYLSLRLMGSTLLAIVGGLCLGYVQDGITTNLASLPTLCLSVFYVGGLIGWFVGVVWYGMALRIPRLRVFGIEPTLPRLGFIMACWVFTIVGGVIFFSLNGTEYMTVPFAIILSAGMGMSYNFALVVLPLFIFWGLQAIPPKSRRARSKTAK